MDFAPLDTEEDAVWTEAREPMEDLIERCRGAIRAIHVRDQENEPPTSLSSAPPHFLQTLPVLGPFS